MYIIHIKGSTLRPSEIAEPFSQTLMNMYFFYLCMLMVGHHVVKTQHELVHVGLTQLLIIKKSLKVLIKKENVNIYSEN